MQIIQDLWISRHPQDRRSLQRDCADGTTEVTFVSVCGGGNCYESEQSYSVVGSDGTEYIGTLETSGSTYTGIPVCLADGDYTVTIFDSWGDGWNGATLYAQVNGGNAYSLTMTVSMVILNEISGVFTLNSSAVYGCTDPTALNYNADATDDDGSCYFTGDVCDAPEVVTDIATGVVDGIAEFYSVSIPSTPGALNITNTGTSGYVWVLFLL